MDIQVTGAVELGENFIVIYRTLDGTPHATRPPKEILAIRAAEYNAEVTDPDIIDMVMLEQFIKGVDEKYHPLYVESIDDAREIVNARIEAVKKLHGHPTGEMSRLSFAATTDKATPGLKTSLGLLAKHADQRIREDIQTMRDHGREAIKDRRGFKQPTFLDQIAREASAIRAKSAPPVPPGRSPVRILP
jgi:hypothetical protein